MADDGVHRAKRAKRAKRTDERRLVYSTKLKKRRRSKWTMDICGGVESLELATTTCERLRGLLFTDPDDVTRLLIPCHDIHTFGMKYPLDVAFISREGKVLKVYREVVAMKRIKLKEASLVAERFSRKGEWLKEGDVIRIGTA